MMNEIIKAIGNKIRLLMNNHRYKPVKINIPKIRNNKIKYPNEIRNKIRYNRAYLLEDRYFVVIDLEFEISNNLNVIDNKLRISKTKSKVLKDNVYVDR